MSRASTIVQEIKQVLQSVAPNQVYRYLKPLDQINDFPTICLYISKDDRPIRETLDYKGEIDLRIRGYVYGEDSQALSDQLAVDIEDAIMSEELQRRLIETQSSDLITTEINELISVNQLSPIVDYSADNVQITEVSTDEGLLEPMGVVEMRVFIRY
jgi:hypothetical protein